MSQQVSADRPLKDISLSSIPAFPAVALRVLDLASQDDPDFDLLVREIASDAALSAQVLRLANSPLFRLEPQVGTVQVAVMLLGAQRVQSLVMSVAMANYSRAALRTQGFQRCWQHTIATAVLCREIAAAAGVRQPEQAYSLGLLHDIGRLGLLVAWPDDYDLMLRKADRNAISLVELERQLFTMDHCELGRRLIEQWKLPQEFCVVAGRHHDPPDGATELDSLRISHLSCRLADALGFWVAKPFGALDVEEVLSELPNAIRVRLPSDPLELREKIGNSLSVGIAVLSQRPPESVRIPSQKSNTPDLNPDLPETGSTDAFLTRFESMPAAWDFSVVVITVIVFTLMLAALYAFSRL
ncbi:MAG TPA: HDOD domain-containing protein [Bryobacteraceae bacterium]